MKRKEKEQEEEPLPHLIATLFNEVQLTKTKHQKHAVQLTQLVNNNFEDSIKYIIQAVNRMIIIKELHASVETTFQFLGKFFSHATNTAHPSPSHSPSLSSKLSTEKCDILLEKFLSHLVNVGSAADNTVRWRCCQLISSVINHLEYSIDDELWEKMEMFLLLRLTDKCPKVRKFAIMALQRFQDINDDQNIVIDQLRLAIDSESNKELKSMMIKILCVTPKTVPTFLAILQGSVIAQSISAKELKKNIFRRFSFESFQICDKKEIIFLITQGVHETPEVKRSFYSMIDSWISSSSLPQFIEFIGVEQNEILLEKMIEYLIESDDHHNCQSIQPYPITKEEYLIYRVHLSSLKIKDICEFEEKMMKGKELLSKLVDHMKEKSYFIVKQILKISLLNNEIVHDELERIEIADKVREYLKEEHPEEIQHLFISLLRSLHDETNFLHMILEILADITELFEQTESEDSFLPSSDDGSVDHLQTMIPTSSASNNNCKPINEEALARNLVLCEELLLHSSPSSSNRNLMIGLLDTLILPSVQHSNDQLRAKGLKCLALFCLMEEKDAGEFLLLFVQAAQKDNAHVQLIAAQSLFDFLSSFNPLYLISQESHWPSDLISQSTKLGDQIRKDEKVYTLCSNEIQSFTMTTLITLLRHNDPLIRNVAVQGFSKLLLNNIITDHHILAVMITLYFHPAISQTPRILYCLNSFFYSFSITDQHKEIIIKSFQPTIKRVLKASKYSPLRIISVCDVFSFISKILQSSHLNEEEERADNNNNNNNNNNNDQPLYSNLNQMIIDLLDEVICMENYSFFKPMIKLIDQHIYLKIKVNEDPSQLLQIQSLFSKLSSKLTIKIDQQTVKQISSLSSRLKKKINEIFPENIPTPSPLLTPSTPSSSVLPSTPSQLSTTTSRLKRAGSPSSSYSEEIFESPPKKGKVSEMDSPYTRILNAIPIIKPPIDHQSISSSISTKKRRKSGRGEGRSLPPSKKHRPSSPSRPPSPNNDDDDNYGEDIDTDDDEDDLYKNEEEDEIDDFHCVEVDPSPLPSSGEIKISFTGFTEEDEVYNKHYQRSLEEMARKLKAEVIEGNDINPKITHIICPPYKRTLKTVIGYLTNRWILPPSWLFDSLSFGHFLTESSYGKRGERSGMEGKKVFVSNQFLLKSPNRQLTPKLFKELLVGFAKGMLTTSTKEADVILHPENLSSKYPNSKCKPLFLTWQTFFKFLQPP